MLDYASRPATTISHQAQCIVTNARRWLQLGLASLWVFAGFLQMQPMMFTSAFAKNVLEPAAEGNPSWIAVSVLWAAHVVSSAPLVWNSLFALIQLALGVGIAYRPWLRFALACSIAWALVVWWFGEGLGGLLTGTASALTGAPGGVILYALLAVLLWPEPRPLSVRYVAQYPVGVIGSRIIWCVLWGGLAALNMQPANLRPNSVHDAVAGMGDGQPAWVMLTVNDFAAFSEKNGEWLTLAGTLVLVAIAVGVFLPNSALRIAVILALLTSAFIWLFGEALGALFGGQATDPNSAPLLALIALAFWPVKSVASRERVDTAWTA